MDPLIRSHVRRLLVTAVLVLVPAASGCGRRAAEGPAPAPRPRLRAEIQSMVKGGTASLDLVDTLGSAVAWGRVAAHYERHHHQPIWSDGTTLRPEATRLVEAIARARETGLDPAHYELDPLRRLLAVESRHDSLADWLRPRTLARFDVRATYAYLRLSHDLRHGRVPGDTLDADWARRDEGAFWERLTDGMGREDPRVTLAALEPDQEDYRRLKAALTRYRAVETAGGWTEIAPGPPIGRGARGPRVGALVRRLAATGELQGPVRDTVMDARLEQAVGDFQSRSGIPRSGIVGETTRAALAVSVGRRIRELELNLERWRWLPRDLGVRHVRVNIPAYRLDLVDSGRVARTMRVVVGKRKSPTPVFSDTLTYLELNPLWTLPPSIVFGEIIPAMKGRPEYLTENRMYVVPISGGRRDTLDPALVPWKKVKPDSFPYLVVKGSGPDNPLGSIKLMCPNEYDVYLHDTPERERFAVAARDFSHGCVRVSGAVELADSLRGVLPADTVRLDSLIASGQLRRLRLPRPVPVHFLYWTAWADSAGLMSFRPDLYGLDERLDRALRERGASFELNPGVSQSPFWLAAHRLAAVRDSVARAGRFPKR